MSYADHVDKNMLDIGVEASESSTYLDESNPNAPAFVAMNEGGHNGVSIKAIALARWIKANRPEWLA